MAAQDFGVDIHLHGNQLLQARYENVPTAPTSPSEGQFYYNTTDKKFYGWNGTAWVDLSQVVSNAMSVKGEIANAASNQQPQHRHQLVMYIE